MKRVIPVLIILVAIAVAISVAWAYLIGSFAGSGGGVFTEQRALPPFSRIAVVGLADVTLVQGAAESVTVEAGAKHVRRVRTEVSDGTLTIASNQARRWWSGLFGGGARPTHVTVTFRALDAINAAGAVKLRADRLRSDRLTLSASGATSIKISDLDTRELAVDGSGAMKVDLAGRAVAQTIAISGAGDYRAADLASEDARVTVSGAGRVLIRVEKSLDVGLSGAGSVEYLGNPKVTEQISGVGRVKRRDAVSLPPAIATTERDGITI
jgi:hypothetical protein